LQDIREFNKREDLPSDLYDLDILDGSPPCTTFSMAGDREESWGVKKKFREGQAEQTLDDLSFVFIETVAKLKPKVMIMENVEGLIKGEAFTYVQKIYKQLHDIGYKVKHWLLKGENMGVPQTRHRVFFVATRLDFDLDKIDMSFNYEPITYGEIKDGLGKPTTEKMYKILCEAKKTEKDGVGAWNRLFNNGGNKRMFFNTILCHNEQVFPTIPAGHNCLFDYENKKAVSSQDLINAQTFPQDFNFIDNSFGNVNYICGMSVPPIMIKRIVNRLIESGLFDYKIKEKL
jgi:DNA (cytosine-5)-methyltransferase 1